MSLDHLPIPRGAVRMLCRLFELHGGDRMKVAESLAQEATKTPDDHRYTLLLTLVMEDKPLRSSANSKVA